MYSRRKRMPHFNEEIAYDVTDCMLNEDGTEGPHWSVEETTTIANQMGINLNTNKYNKWDWYVVLNMIYSDFYKAIASITGGTNTKHFVELAKAWLCDKDVPDGKVWKYFNSVVCDGELEEEYYESEPQRYRNDNHSRYDRKEEYAEYNEPRERRNTSIRYF